MLVTEKQAIEGARIFPIGQIKATTPWQAAGLGKGVEEWRQRVLRELIRRAEDVDADAVVSVDYRIEPVEGELEGGVELERICATGLAVRIAEAA